ncbi:hypothetical protein [Acinetobacter sp. NS4_7]
MNDTHKEIDSLKAKSGYSGKPQQWQYGFDLACRELAKTQAVPNGYVVVPKQPTQELLNKMQDYFVGAFENGLTGGQSIHCAYIAMIEAREQAND